MIYAKDFLLLAYRHYLRCFLPRSLGCCLGRILSPTGIVQKLTKKIKCPNLNISGQLKILTPAERS